MHFNTSLPLKTDISRKYSTTESGSDTEVDKTNVVRRQTTHAFPERTETAKQGDQGFTTIATAPLPLSLTKKLPAPNAAPSRQAASAAPPPQTIVQAVAASTLALFLHHPTPSEPVLQGYRGRLQETRRHCVDALIEQYVQADPELRHDGRYDSCLQREVGHPMGGSAPPPDEGHIPLTDFTLRECRAFLERHLPQRWVDELGARLHTDLSRFVDACDHMLPEHRLSLADRRLLQQTAVHNGLLDKTRPFVLTAVESDDGKGRKFLEGYALSSPFACKHLAAKTLVSHGYLSGPQTVCCTQEGVSLMQLGPYFEIQRRDGTTGRLQCKDLQLFNPRALPHPRMREQLLDYIRQSEPQELAHFPSRLLPQRPDPYPVWKELRPASAGVRYLREHADFLQQFHDDRNFCANVLGQPQLPLALAQELGVIQPNLVLDRDTYETLHTQGDRDLRLLLLDDYNCVGDMRNIVLYRVLLDALKSNDIPLVNAHARRAPNVPALANLRNEEDLEQVVAAVNQDLERASDQLATTVLRWGLPPTQLLRRIQSPRAFAVLVCALLKSAPHQEALGEYVSHCRQRGDLQPMAIALKSGLPPQKLLVDACQKGDLDTVRCVLENSPRIEEKINLPVSVKGRVFTHKRTYLQCAQEAGHRDVVALLESWGATSGCSARHHAGPERSEKPSTTASSTPLLSQRT